MQALSKQMQDLPEAIHDEFRANTPIRSGNARRNTKLKKNQIVADYPYSQRLEEGWSKQAPDGITKPTLEWIYKEVDRRLKGL